MNSRTVWIAAGAASALAGIVLAVTRPSLPLLPDAGGGTSLPSSFGSASSVPAGTPSGTLSGSIAPQTTLSPSSTGSGTATASGAPFLVVGSERDNRVIAGRLSDIRADLAAGRGELTARVLSPEVGASFHLMPLPGLRLVVAATNHAELVLLTDGLRKVRTLNVRASVDPGGSGPFSYGSLALDGTTLYVAAAWGNSVAVVAVDTEAWRVVRSRVLPDRIGQFPHVCLTTDKTLAVVTSEHLSLVRPGDLTVLRQVRVGDHPVGLACSGNEVFVSDFIEPVVYRYGSDGRSREPIRYEGNGSSVVHAADGMLYLTDEEDDKVVRCPVTGSGCTASANLGSPIASLLRVGDLLFAARDSRGEVSVLDATTLAPRGVLPVPGGPRGLALMTS